ncbi:MAG: arginine repressor [Actinobacteria bacterium]|nr:arginine repressor [Actinomycetota bacterium]
MTTRTARLHKIAQLIATKQVSSQSELVHLLSEVGISVTQATLSRDLENLGAIKVHGADGASFYAIPEDSTRELPTKDQSRLARTLADLMASATHSGNIVVLRTPPGAASYLASALDRGDLDSVIGTVAGDDTVMVITRDPNGGETVAEQLTELAGQFRTSKA